MRRTALLQALASSLILIVVAVALVGCGSKSTSGDSAQAVTDSAIVINPAEVTGEPRFYPATISGEDMEVLAIKASDGSIRTAYNTCQVCYNSGKGYYQWQDGALVCQNCGNQFAPDQVEVQVGGCNPVPIFDEAKEATESKITIPLATLQQALTTFANWKK
jgi:uncharacterized membrane protein